MSWRTAFRASDDAALTAIANPGLLRRAKRTVEAGGAVLASEDATGGVVDVGTASVRLTAVGPAGARCDCPAAGVCEHILAAAILVREDTGDGAVEPTGSALEELLALDPLAVARKAGIAATRRARSVDGSVSASVSATEAVVEIRLTGDDRVVRFLAGAGFDGIVSEYPAAARSERHLTAVRLVFTEHGRDWRWPAGSDAVAGSDADALTAPQLAAIAETESVCVALLRSGLSHLGEDAADRLGASAVGASIAGLHRLGRLAAAAAGLTDEIVARADAVAERDLAGALAEVAALCAALRRTGGDPVALAALRGVARRSFEEAGTARLLPVDALWFDAPTGGRGATFTFLERDTGELVSSTAARASGADPGFRRESPTLIWGSSADRVTSAEFTLRRPRSDPSGALAAGDLSTVDLGSSVPLSEEAFRSFAVADWSRLEAGAGERVSFGSGAVRAHLLAPATTGALELDEVAQRLALPLLDRDGARVDASVPTGNSRRADALVAQVESRATIMFAFVRRGAPGAPRDVLDLTSVVVRQKNALRLVPLDFTTIPKTPKRSALRERLDRLVAKLAPASPGRVVAVARSVVERVGLPVLDVLDEVTATGRPRLDERQASILDRQASMARDLAMTSVAEAVAAVRAADPVDPAAVLRCWFVIDRVLAVG